MHWEFQRGVRDHRQIWKLSRNVKTESRPGVKYLCLLKWCTRSAACICGVRWFLSSGKQKAYLGTINSRDGSSYLQLGCDQSLHFTDHHCTLLPEQLEEMLTWREKHCTLCFCVQTLKGLHLYCYHGNTNWFSRMTNDAQAPVPR